MKPSALLAFAAGLLLSLPSSAQAEGIALPALTFAVNGGAWAGNPCPQPGAWGQPVHVNAPSGSTCSVRVSFLVASNLYILAIGGVASTAFNPGPPFTGPLLLQPGAYAILHVAAPGPIPNPVCYSDGITFTSSVPLAPGTTFGLQALTPDFFGWIFSPLLVVHVT